jgi:hypothetical protein
MDKITKELLRKECIGMLEDKSESWDRFEQFFGWKFESAKKRYFTGAGVTHKAILF